MNRHSIFSKLFLTVLLLSGTVPVLQAQNTLLKKRPNIALSIPNDWKTSSPQKNYFNLGLMSNYQNLNGASFNIFSDIALQKTSGFQVSGLVNITGIRSSGFQVAGLANVAGIKSHGLRVAGLFNISGRSAYGFQFSGLGNISGDNLKGAMFSGLLNMSSIQMKGLMLAGLANIAGSEQRGLAIGGFMNVSSSDMKGVQFSSLMNITGNRNYGLQLSPVSNISVNNKGVQIGALANFSANNKGLQVGTVNISNKGEKGVQTGIININGDSCARQIGLINIKPGTRTQMIISGGNINKTNVGIRFKNKYIYTQLGAGAYYGDFNKLAISATYRTGLSFPLVKNKLFLNTDIGYSHIETLNNKDVPDRLYAIQPKIGLEYNPLKKFGVFFSGGYSWTRTYKNGTSYSKDPIIEAGIILF